MMNNNELTVTWSGQTKGKVTKTKEGMMLEVEAYNKKGERYDYVVPGKRQEDGSYHGVYGPFVFARWSRIGDLYVGVWQEHSTVWTFSLPAVD